MNTFIKEFFAVTVSGSLYRIESRKEPDGSPTVTKVALTGKSVVPVGRKLAGHGLLSVGKALVMYTPDAHGLWSPQTSFERDIAKVNTQWWHDNTSAVVALFLDGVAARLCLTEHDDHVPCDPRWLESTKIVLSAIGDNHPDFVITHSHGLALIESEVGVVE